ncbi:MAG: hypothetical protein JW749_00605 [Sedimentisphaerales bacterium]|nr:hypothetical protein [Sedimentisphaerales bacterium]
MPNLSGFEPIADQESGAPSISDLIAVFSRWDNPGDLEQLGFLAYICPKEYPRQIIRHLLMLEKGESTFVQTPPPKKTDSTSSWPEEYKFSEQVSDSCLEFADSHGLNETLEQCFRTTRKLFSRINSLSADLDRFRDEEPEDIGHIVIRVEVRSGQRVALREYDSWAEWMIRNLTPSECTRITLTVRRI